MSVVPNNQWGGISTPDLSEEDLLYFCKVIEDRAGISLKASKRDLIGTRLRPRVRAHGFESFRLYRQYLASLSPNDPEWQVFTNLLTTNKTDFFRESRHFDYLVESILPEWLESKAQTFTVWSAASSTGEEAYTLAMVLDRYLPKDRNFKILATDIDTEVIAKAQNAVYSNAKKEEIPQEYHSRCLDFGKGDVKGWFRIKRHLKERIVFKQHNLIEKMAPAENAFDLVLCRNVLIYFLPETINFVQKKLYSTVKPQGYFFIGHSESLQGLNHCWKTAGPSVFRKG
jgi:chemotaxis protein methyltransferase CheR